MAKNFQAQQKWHSLLKEFYASNQSAHSWCHQHSVSYQSFLHWKKRLKAENNNRFIKLKQEESIKLSWKGVRISFSRLEDFKHLKSLLEALC